MTIVDSMISDNLGPGVWNITGFLTVKDSTLSDNSAGQASAGGGILSGTLFKAPAFVTVINSTITGNSASAFGGGIAGGYWGVTIANSTVSGNSAKSGGGIYTYGTVQISNTILNAGASGENIFNNGGTVTSHGYNVSSDNGGGYLNGPGDQINTDPLLGPLQDNGGPTLTHMPLPGSPAIDAGDPTFTPPPFHDQRGPCFYRVFGRPRGRIDVGSVEVQPGPRCPTPAPRPTPPPRP
jgi:predicted outer membrane repeat protein